MNTTAKTAFYLLDPKTGALSKRPVLFDQTRPEVREFKYNERFLESLLVLNPFLFGGEGHMPLVAHGGQSSADLVHRDDIGRLVAVECKDEKAKCADLVQLLGYGHQLPFEPERAPYGPLLGVDVAMLRAGNSALSKACLDVFNMESRVSLAKAKAVVDEALGGGPLVDDLTSRAQERLGLGNLTVLDLDQRFETSARMVLVARGFRDDCVELCAAMSARTVDVSLVQIEVFDSPAGRVVAHSVVHEPKEMHAVREAIGRVWRDARARSQLRPLGWVFSKENPSFKFAGRQTPNVTIEMLAADERVVAMRIPHSTFEPNVVEKMKAKLDGCLPRGFTKGSSDWIWTGRWTAEQWAEIAIQVANRSYTALDDFR